MSQYASGGLPKLPTSKNDGDEFEKFLKRCNFKVTRIHDENANNVIDEFSAIDNLLENAKGDSTKSIQQTKIAVFIYYSGHGFLINGQTVGVTISGDRFSLEENVRKMSTRTNCLLMGLFDCCREIPNEGTKGAVQAKTRGRLILIYAVGPGKSATTRTDPTGMSKVTRDFLKVMDSSVGPFPECIESWRWSYQTVELVEKAAFQFYLKPAPIAIGPISFVPPDKKFIEWLPHEIAEWSTTLKLSKSYSNKIIQSKINGSGFMAIMEESAWVEFGFDEPIDNLAIKSAIKKLLLS